MSHSISLKDAEQRVFQTATNDGTWDILLGCFFLMFAIAPLLSASLGDFWSSAVFLPFWGAAYVALRLIRKHVVRPRIGSVRFGKSRRAVLSRFNVILLVLNLLTFVLGLFAAAYASRIPGQVMGFALGLILLGGFSFAAFYLGISRLYVYGLLTGLGPPIGEWLWTRGLVSHHGYPLMFGFISGTMIFVGLALLLRLIAQYPASDDDQPLESM
ncbi:MAG: hypothetical protein P8X64_02965 [Anaerolineales bacterium]|jgi:hypothetical protein